jgi:hypothetical protein
MQTKVLFAGVGLLLLCDAVHANQGVVTFTNSPEPSTFILLVIGVAALWLVPKWRTGRRRANNREG